MNILEFILLSLWAVLLLLIVPLLVLWDIFAFIAFLATFKASPEKHKACEKFFIVSSSFLTAAAALTGIIALIFFAAGSL